MDNINLLKYCVHHIVTSKPIHILPMSWFSLQHMPTIIVHLKMINGNIFVCSLALIASTPNYNFHIM